MQVKVKNHEPQFERRKIRDIKDMLTTSCILYSKQDAYQYKDENGEIKSKTYEQLGNDVNYMGTALMNMGLRTNVISVIGENSYKWAVVYLATVCGLGQIAPMDKSLTEVEIENLLLQGSAEAIFYDPRYEEKIANIKERGNTTLQRFINFESGEFERLLELGKKLVEGGHREYIDAVVHENDIDVLLFTSGTTNKSKAVQLTHKNIVSNMMSISSIIEYKSNDKWLSYLPLHHIYESILGFLDCLYNGVCICICEGTRYINQNLKEYQISMFACVPLILEKLYKDIQALEAKGNITKQDVIEMLGGHLRFIYVGAGAIAKETVAKFRDLGIDIVNAYGMTESSAILATETIKKHKSGSIGFAAPNMELVINEPDEDGMGELWARGDIITVGYYKNDEANAETFIDGWYHTGDLVYVDDEGFLYCSGRKKNLIAMKNGKKIFPEEIEGKLNQNPMVLESFVYAVDRGTGHDLEVCAKMVYNRTVIEAKYGKMTEDEIYTVLNLFRKEINQTLPMYKSIRKLTVTEEPLIKTTTNKIKRNEEMKKMGL